MTDAELEKLLFLALWEQASKGFSAAIEDLERRLVLELLSDI